jgi:hypothetical protein
MPVGDADRAKRSPSRAKTDRRIPTLEELPRIFDEKFVREQRPPRGTDVPLLAAAILEATQRYVAEMAIPSDPAMRDEIRALYSAASRHRYKEAAARISRLSAQTRAILKKRGDRRSIGLVIPEPEAFTDPARRDEACETIVRLLRVGGMKGGKPILYEPQVRSRPPRRDAERTLVMWLEVAYYEASGKTKPTFTADPGVARPGPLTRLVQAVLDRVAGPGVNAVEMINELHRRRTSKRLQSGTAPKP